MATAATLRPSLSRMQDSPSSGIVCPECGTLCAATPAQLSGDGQRRIAELENQVRILTDKATAAADKLADYEDELRNFKTQASAAESARQLPQRFSSLLGSGRSSPNLSGQHAAAATAAPSTPPPPLPSTPSRRESDLQAALEREQSLRQQEEALRQQAEGKLKDMSGELEELSAQLFQQANEMVSAERKARARLEERVEVLERRDAEKRKRLERLEGAMKRIDRLRTMLAPPPG